MVSLGIDIGTTNITVLALDLDTAAILESHSLPNPRMRTTDQFSYLQDPYAIEAAVRTLLSRLHQPYACAAVTGQVHGILYVDKIGNAVSPLQTWLDRSALEPIEGTCAQQRLLDRCGKTMPNGYGFVTHYANRLRKRVPETAVGFTGILEYITSRLVGKPLWKSDPSSLATFGAYDPVTKSHDRDIVKEMMGETDLLFPSPADAYEPAGTFGDGIAVGYPVGDNQAGFLGVVADPLSSCLVSIGTSGQLSLYSPTPICPASMELRPFLDEGYLQVGATLTAGKAYETLEKFIHSLLNAYGSTTLDHEQVFSVMKKAALDEPMSHDALIVNTTLSGTRRDGSLRGSILDIGLDNLTLGNLVRGTVDGIIRELLDFTVDQDAVFSSVRTVVATGSAVRKNQLFPQSLASQFKKQVLIAEVEDGSAVGAALIAAISAGRLTRRQSKKIVAELFPSHAGEHR